MLEDAIESARNQTYGNLEIIVSDDASPSVEVGQLLKRYENTDSVHIYRNSKNVGRVVNYRTTLYERAKGDWVVNLDGDDYFKDPAFIEKAMGIAETDPLLVMVSGRCVELMPDGNTVLHQENSGNSRVLSSMDAYEALYAREYLPFHGATLYRRSVAKAIGFYTSDTITSDFHSLLKLIQAGNVGIVESEAVVHRTHDSNASVDMSIDDWIDNAGVFFAPLDGTGAVVPQASGNFLRDWTGRYAYREGRAIAYNILKKHGSNHGYRAYLRAMNKHSRKVARKILFQPKNITKYIKNMLGF